MHEIRVTKGDEIRRNPERWGRREKYEKKAECGVTEMGR
jgi:hypothetical protein